MKNELCSDFYSLMVRIPKVLENAMKEYCKENMMSYSTFVRISIKDFLDKKTQKE